MAPKKGSVNNSMFMKQVSNAAKKEVQAVDDSQSQKYQDFVQNIDKQSQYIDIDLMDDAPNEINNFPRLKDQQPEMYLRLKMSIYEYGVLQPLLLVKKPDDRYMIISGHNRRDLCREIIAECQNNEGFDPQKYKYLLSKVYEKEELSDKQILDYIDETNCLQRDLSKMDQRTKINLLQRQMVNLSNRKYARGERIDKLAQEMGLEKTSIYENLAIAEKIIEPFKEMYFNCQITRKAVLRFPLFDKFTQEWMWENFGEKMKENQILMLKKSMGREEIEELFTSDGVKHKRIYVTIPESREKAVKELLKLYLHIPEGQEQKALELLKQFIPEQ